MSVRVHFNGALDTETGSLSTTTATDILEGGESGTWVDSIVLQDNGSGDTVSLSAYDGSTEYFFVKSKALSANERLEVSIGFMLRKDWSLRMKLASGNTVFYHVNYVETAT